MVNYKKVVTGKHYYFAAYHRLDNLSIIIDYNNLQSLDSVDNTLSFTASGQEARIFWLDNTYN